MPVRPFAWAVSPHPTKRTEGQKAHRRACTGFFSFHAFSFSSPTHLGEGHSAFDYKSISRLCQMEGTGQQKGAPFPLGTAPLSGYRAQKPYGILLNVQPPAGRNGGGVLLGQRQFQHAVFVTAADLLALDVGDVKTAAKRSIGAFPAHIAVLSSFSSVSVFRWAEIVR